MNISSHRLTGVTFAPAHLRGPGIVPELLVIHYTATLEGRGVIRAFQAESAGASAHLVIDLDGTVTQMVEFNQRAAHAGKSSWRGRDSCNNFSIGIELVNPGPLYRTETGYVDTIGRRPWTGGVVDERHKNGGPFTHWAAYPEQQVDSLREVTGLLVSAYGLRDIVGHDDIAPARKIDPGPAFPMRTLLGLLGDRQQDGPDLYETTTTLVVRGGPGTQFPPAGGSPLPPNTKVDVLQTESVWRLVRTPDAAVEGWCFGQYLAPA